MTKVQVLEKIFTATIDQGLGEVKERTMEEKGGPEITVKEVQDKSCYSIFYVQNNEETAKYCCNCEFTDMIGMQLLEPFLDETQFQLTVEPQQTGMQIIKKFIRKFSYSKLFSEQVILGEEAIIAKTIDEGKKTERTEGIDQYYLQHSAGISFVYTNNTEESTLVETLTFKVTGLEVVGQDDTETPVEVRCGPGETKDVQLRIVGNGGFTFGMSISLYIE